MIQAGDRDLFTVVSFSVLKDAEDVALPGYRHVGITRKPLVEDATHRPAVPLVPAQAQGEAVAAPEVKAAFAMHGRVEEEDLVGIEPGNACLACRLGQVFVGNRH